VTVLDSNGNVVTNSSAPVTLNITEGTGTTGATLSGNSTSAIFGTATFYGLAINRAGKGYTLTASSGNLTAAVSIPFGILHPGDADGNGLDDMGDVVEVERVILGLDPTSIGCDANGDGLINVGDVTKIERIILGLDPLN